MRLLMLSLLLLLPALASAGKIYRWVDAQGQAHYGEAPPAGVSAAAQRKLVPAASTEAPVASAAASTKATKTAATTPSRPAPAAKGDKEIREKNCAAGKARIEFLETSTAHRIQVPQKDGTTARMTDEEFEKDLAEAKKAVANNCGS